MIEISSMSFSYKEKVVFNDLSLSIPKGQSVAILGPDGSGKSTFLKLLSGFLRPSAGTLCVDKKNISKEMTAIKRMIGYLSENTPLYSKMSVIDFLSFIGQLRKLSDIPSKIENIGKIFHLESIMNLPISKLSKAQRQHVGLAQALIHRPKVVLL